jgi:hypothetical protein
MKIDMNDVGIGGDPFFPEGLLVDNVLVTDEKTKGHTNRGYRERGGPGGGPGGGGGERHITNK